MSYCCQPYNQCITYNYGWIYVEQVGVLTKVVPPAQTTTLITDILPLFKEHARIDFPNDDALCKMYLGAAISRIEQWTGMPVAYNEYTWEIAEQYQTYEMYQLPLRNCNMSGIQHGFDDLEAPKWIPAPTTWPVTLEVGFLAGADVPDDIMLSIYELALSLYQQRSNTEMLNVYAAEIMQGNLGRYWVPRV